MSITLVLYNIEFRAGKLDIIVKYYIYIKLRKIDTYILYIGMYTISNEKLDF